MIFSKMNPASGSGCGTTALEVTQTSRPMPEACTLTVMLAAPPE